MLCYRLSVWRGDIACIAAMTCSCLATCSTCSAYFLFKLSICCSMVSMSASCLAVLPMRCKFCSSLCRVVMSLSSVLLLSRRRDSFSLKLFTCTTLAVSKVALFHISANISLCQSCQASLQLAGGWLMPSVHSEDSKFAATNEMLKTNKHAYLFRGALYCRENIGLHSLDSHSCTAWSDDKSG